MSILNSALTFFGFSDDDEDITESSAMIHNVSQTKPTIHPINQTNSQKLEIRISFPRTYEDSVNIATHLQKNRASIG